MRFAAGTQPWQAPLKKQQYRPAQKTAVATGGATAAFCGAALLPLFARAFATAAYRGAALLLFFGSGGRSSRGLLA